jgi:hypothetical protein
MADEKEPKAKAIDGMTKPIDPSKGIPPHISEHTLMVKGVDPDTKERVTISLAALQFELGAEKGLDKYSRIAKAGGFLDPSIESRGGSHYFPDLSLDGMEQKARDRVDAILKEA